MTSTAQGRAVAKLRKRLRRKSARRTLLRVAFWSGSGVLVALVVTCVLASRVSGPATDRVQASSAAAVMNPLDQVSSADIALTVSRMTGVAETKAITAQAISEDTNVAVAQTTNSVTAKPQIVATAFKSNKDIQTYVVQAGDTITSIAAKFSVTSASIRWSNNISGDAVSAGVKLLIPPVGYSGIVYTVKSGDTIDGLAAKYKADKSELIAANDAEIGGIHVGEQIIIPNGQQPVATYSYGRSYGFAWGGAAIYGYNGYDYGYCTWWVAQRRMQVGHALPSNLGNASSWPYTARLAGLAEGSTPRLYAAAVTSTYGEGHVVFVEGVNADGSIVISEMNHLGWGVKDTQVISAAQAARYIYIY